MFAICVRYVYMIVYMLFCTHRYSDIIMGAMASQITRLASDNPTAHSGADQRKHQSSESLAFVRGIRRWPVNSPRKGPVRREMFPFDDVIMILLLTTILSSFRPSIYHMACCQCNPYVQSTMKIKSKYIDSRPTKWNWKCRPENFGHSVSASMW